MEKTYKVTSLADDKEVFTGSAKEIVRSMASRAFIAAGKDDWMLGVRDRIELLYGKSIRVTGKNYLGFLVELKKLGVIKIELETIVNGKVVWKGM